MNSLQQVWANYHFRMGWRLFVAGWYLSDCDNADQCAGYHAAWKASEGI